MRRLTEAQFERTVVDYIVKELPNLSDRRRTVPKGELTPEAPLFQGGFVDSLGFVHLLAFVEELLGMTVPEEKIVMRNFRTVRAIWRAFGGVEELATGGRRVN